MEHRTEEQKYVQRSHFIPCTIFVIARQSIDRTCTAGFCARVREASESLRCVHIISQALPLSPNFCLCVGEPGNEATNMYVRNVTVN